MATIQQNLALYNQMEIVLRKAKLENAPLTVRDVFEAADVQRIAMNEFQVRDRLKVLVEKNLVSKVDVPASQAGDKRGKFGYMWKEDSKSITDLSSLSLSSKQATVTHISAMTSRKVVENKDIELVYNGVVIIIGKNPITNRLKITIE